MIEQVRVCCLTPLWSWLWSLQGADNHDGSRKEWEERKRVAIQAYAEWIPVRGLSSEEPDLAGCHRTFHFGDLATLVSCGRPAWPGDAAAAAGRR